MWEIHDPNELEYDTYRGISSTDSGEGPPSLVQGWVREGMDTCPNWATSDPIFSGTNVALDSEWDNLDFEELVLWRPFTFSCSSNGRVWCVQD